MRKYKLGLILTMLMWGSLGIFVRYIDFTSSQIALFRAVIGSLFLLLFSILSKEKISKESIKQNLGFLVVGSVCLGLNWIFLFESYNYTTISVATICYYLAPIIVMLMSPILFKERLTLTKILCIIAALVGMIFIVELNKESISSNNIVGILYGLSAAVFYAGVVISNKYLKNISGKESSIIQLSISSIFLIIYVFLTDRINLNSISFNSVTLLLILGIVHTGIAYLIYFSVIQKLDSQTVALYSYIDPISAIIFSSLLLSEKMSLYQILGGILIIGSTLVNEMHNKKLEGKELEETKEI